MKVAVVASPAEPVAADAPGLGGAVWRLCAELADAHWRVCLLAPGGSSAPLGADLRYIPGGYGDPLPDAEALAWAWYQQDVLGCDLVHDLTDAGRLIEQLYLHDPARPYLWSLRAAMGGPRFGRRNAVVAGDPHLAALHPWAFSVPALEAAHLLPVYHQVLGGQAAVAPVRMWANPGRALFQAWCAELCPGAVLNAGASHDPAGLKDRFGDRVTNLDLPEPTGTPETVAAALGARDVAHDLRQTPWPFPDDAFGLCVLGDVLEDLPDDGCQVAVLAEAARVARALCLTWPVDGPERDSHHLSRIPEERMRGWLQATGWAIRRWVDTDYGFVPMGHCVLAERGERA